MIYFAVMFGLLAGALWRTTIPEPLARVGGRMRVAALTLALICGIAAVLEVVPPGHAGVPVVFGKVANHTLSEGLHVVNPFAKVELLSVRTETYSMNASADEGPVRGDDSIYVLSADGVSMPMDVSVAYRLVPGDAPWVYRNLGRNYVEGILRPAARSAVPEAVSKFTFQDAYSLKREEMVTLMQQIIGTKIKKTVAQFGFDGQALQVQEVFLRKIQLPANLKQAIEHKMQSEQEAERMAFILQREEREAERKRIEARGIRDFQAIVTEGISDKLLQWKGIEATEELAKSPNAKLVLVGSGKGGLPVILNPGQ